jgi:hypothetical protein
MKIKEQLLKRKLLRGAGQAIADYNMGPSVIQCCYAAILCSLTPWDSTVTPMKMIIKRILSGTAANTSLKRSRLETNPACMAGVLISDPNFSAL